MPKHASSRQRTEARAGITAIVEMTGGDDSEINTIAFGQPLPVGAVASRQHFIG